MKKIFLMCFISCLFFTANLFAECKTTVSGVIDGQIWTVDGSPYCVDGDIVVLDLEIGPGVRVEFLGDYSFEVNGQLNAIGTISSPITFTVATGISGWQGIRFTDSSTNSQLIYCSISGSNHGGLHILNSFPTISNCSISGNHSDVGGGGLYVLLDTTPDELVLSNCRINHNTSETSGGGIKAELSSGSLTLENCEINNNRNNSSNSNGNYHGGGMYILSATGGLNVKNSEISGNTSYSKCTSTNCSTTDVGGGVYIGSGRVTFTNCVITSNESRTYNAGCCTEYSRGGGIYHSNGLLKLTNCIISANSVNSTGPRSSKYEYGGGIFTADATVDIENCTIAYNTKEGIYNSGGIVQAINSIIYFNSGDSISGTATVTYSDIQGGHAGEGNIDENPLFEPDALKVSCEYSPCIDAGNSFPPTWYNDICFPPSCRTEANDMGAHGGPGACGWCVGGACDPLITKPLTGDLDGDGDVDAVDLVIFSANYGNEAIY